MTAPATLEDFLRRPSRQAWEAELCDGWPGPDGSSMSTDTIMGVRIGVTGPGYRHVDLPANRHDWYYRLGRRYELPEEWRAAADAVYRDLCIERCSAALTGWRRVLLPAAWARAHARYAALRAGAKYAWTRKAQARERAWCLMPVREAENEE